MKIGVIFPQTEIGTDPAAIRDFAQAVEGMDFDHLVAYDHVAGGNPASHPGLSYATIAQSFHEPFVLFGYLASLTHRVGLATGILVLPQRQTVLVAKQAAEVDLLSGGRLRLGVAIGWNPLEYEALGEDFRTRGRRIEEQIRVLRALWTQRTVTFRGRWHRLDDAGINPLPVQRPIPLWMGGEAEPVLRRAARLADGWIPSQGPATEARRELLSRLRGYLQGAGRDPNEFGVEPRLSAARGGPEEWRQQAKEWQDLGATHLSVSTTRAGLEALEDHLRAIERFKEALSA